MKKLNKKSFAVVGLALVLSATALTGCNSDELDAKIDENASKAEAAVSEAASKAADDLAAAKSALEAKISSGDTANADELKKAIEDLNKAIDEAKKVAGEGDTTLNAAIEAASQTAAAASKVVADQVAALATKLDDQIAALKIMLENKEANITAVLTEAATQITTLQETLKTVEQAGSETAAKLEAQKTELLEIMKNAYVSIDAWNGNTAVAAKKATELKTAYDKLDTAGMSAEIINKIDSVYMEQTVKIMRALTEAQAETARKYAVDLFEGVLKIMESYQEKKSEGTFSADAQKKLDEYYNEALEDVIALEQHEEGSEGKTIESILKELENNFKSVLSDEQLAKAENIVAEIDALSAALDAKGYVRETADQYAIVSDHIEQWYEKAGANAEDKIGKAKVDALNKKYNEKKKIYDDEAKKLQDELAPYIAENYVFVYSDEAYKAVAETLKGKVDAWKTASADKGFAAGDKDAHAVYASINTFENGALKRAIALKTAKSEANTINSKIKALTKDINEMTMILVEYQVRFGEIKTQVETWNKTYFENYAAEAKVGNTNYDLLDHAAYDALTDLYNKAVLGPIAGIKEICDKLEDNFGDMDDISLRSWPNIAELQTMYGAFQAKFNKMVGSLQLVEGINHSLYTENTWATGEDVFNYYADVIETYNKLAETADADYEKLTVLKSTDAALKKKAELDALVAWYEKYLELDITSADTEYPAGETFKLCGKHTIDEAAFQAACGAYETYQKLVALEAEKVAELEKLAAEIKKAKKTTELRGTLDSFENLRMSLLQGSYGQKDGYSAGQCLPTEEMKAKIVELNQTWTAANDQVSQLEKDLKSIQDRINAVAKLDLTVEANRTAAKAEVASIQTAIKNFLSDNLGVDCIGLDSYKKLHKVSVAASYAVAVAKIDALADGLVKDDLTDRVKATKAAADKAIDEMTDSTLDLSLAEAQFELVAYVVDVYAANVNGLTAEKLQANYQGAQGLYDQFKNPSDLAHFKSLFKEHINSKKA